MAECPQQTGRNLWLKDQADKYCFLAEEIDYIYHVENYTHTWTLKARLNTGIVLNVGTESSENAVKDVRDKMLVIVGTIEYWNQVVAYPYDT